MSSRCLSRLIAVVLCAVAAAAAQPATLRVCADPDNLPFSNRQLQGFENKLAALVAADLGRKLEYHWARHSGRGFIRTVLNEGQCDLLLSVPQGFAPVLTTSPYYRSAYVFVTPQQHAISHFDDPALRSIKIGVQIAAEEYAPPAVALGRRGLVANIVGYEAVGRESGNIIGAVARGEVGAAVVWGPLAGYHARRHGRRLRVSLAPQFDAPALPLAFAISMGVRKGNAALRDEVEAVLLRRRERILTILRQYHVPLLPLPGAEQEQARR